MKRTTQARIDRLEGPALAARLAAADREWGERQADFSTWRDEDLAAFVSGAAKLNGDGPRFALTLAEKTAVGKCLAMTR